MSLLYVCPEVEMMGHQGRFTLFYWSAQQFYKVVNPTETMNKTQLQESKYVTKVTQLSKWGAGT